MQWFAIILAFGVGFVLGAGVAAVSVFNYLDGELRRLGIDILEPGDPPVGIAIACGFDEAERKRPARPSPNDDPHVRIKY